MLELVIFIVCSGIAIFGIGTMVHRALNKDVDTIEKNVPKKDKPNDEILLSNEQISNSNCTCNPPQGAPGWRCGSSPCEATQRLVTTTCMPAGCGESQGVKEVQCISDAQCCDEFRDTIYCGTGNEAPDCPVGSRILQKLCGENMASYDCRVDSDGPEVDNSPSCLPKCLGRFSLNEAAAIADPEAPILCPGDDNELNAFPGPWSRDESGVGIQSQIIGTGASACNPTNARELPSKCKLYCAQGYQPSPDGKSCRPMACQKDAIILNDTISDTQHPPGSAPIYTYQIPRQCPLIDNASYITFAVTLNEANLQLFNHETSQWDTLSQTGDNNQLFESIKLYPLSSDKKYFSNNTLQWQITQAANDQDEFFSRIIAVECDHPPMALHTPIQDPSEVHSQDEVIVRTLSIPESCSPVNEASYIAVDIQLINATLQVYDVNSDRFSEISTSGADNQLFLTLKYRPLGPESRFFNNNQITWRITKANGGSEQFRAGISMTDCYRNLCDNTFKGGWFNTMGSGGTCDSLCASLGLSSGISPEGMSCASGENRPMTGTGIISYVNQCHIGLGCNANIIGPIETQQTHNYCYRAGQIEDNQPTDQTTACYCE